MATQCTSNAFPLAGLGRRQVVAKFDGGRLSSDGAVLLRAANQAFQVTGRLAACFIDHRNPARVEHSLESLLGQRVFALALGYEDINDHDRLRDDSLLALALCRQRDRGHVWLSTLNRLELGTLGGRRGPLQEGRGEHGTDRTCWWICSDMHKRMLVDTDDQLHGQQEGRFYHGYYRHLLPAAVHHVRRACAVCAPDGAARDPCSSDAFRDACCVALSRPKLLEKSLQAYPRFVVTSLKKSVRACRWRTGQGATIC